jgi:hypothetical protein
MSINNYESGVVNYDEEQRYSAANGYQLCYYSNFKYSGFTRKGKQKNGVATNNDKEIRIDSNYFRNYFITWSIVFTIRR